MKTEKEKYLDFLKLKTESEVDFLAKTTIDAIQKNDERALNATKFICLSIIVYYVFKFNIADNFNFLGISIKSSKFLLMVTPSVLCIFNFVFVKCQSRKISLRKFYDAILTIKFKVEYTKKEHWLTDLTTPIEFNSSLFFPFKGKNWVLNIPVFNIFSIFYLPPCWVIINGIYLTKSYYDSSLLYLTLIAFPIIVSLYTLVILLNIIHQYTIRD